MVVVPKSSILLSPVSGSAPPDTTYDSAVGHSKRRANLAAHIKQQYTVTTADFIKRTQGGISANFGVFQPADPAHLIEDDYLLS